MQKINDEGVTNWKFFHGVFPRGFLPRAERTVVPLLHQ